MKLSLFNFLSFSQWNMRNLLKYSGKVTWIMNYFASFVTNAGTYLMNFR